MFSLLLYSHLINIAHLSKKNVSCINNALEQYNCYKSTRVLLMQRCYPNAVAKNAKNAVRYKATPRISILLRRREFCAPRVENHRGYSIRPAPPSIGWTGRRPLVPHRVTLFLLLLHERARTHSLVGRQTRTHVRTHACMHSRTWHTHARAASWRWGPETASCGEARTRQEGRKCPIVGYNTVGRKTGWIVREASRWPNPRWGGQYWFSSREIGENHNTRGRWHREWESRVTGRDDQRARGGGERLPHLLLLYRGLPLSLFLLSVGRHWQLYVRATVTINIVMRASVQFVVLLWRFSFFFFSASYHFVPRAVVFFVHYKEIESTLVSLISGCTAHRDTLTRICTLTLTWSYNS